MKKYKEYMDQITASDTLHQRMVELEAPVKRPIPWKRYGAMAAALVLVCGLGAWGLSGGFPFAAGRGEGIVPETAGAVEPDIAPVEPGEAGEPGEKTLGGYDVVSGGIVAHYILPAIDYGEVEAVQGKVSLDWALGEGFTEGPVSQEEIVALLGGEDALSTHLDWDGYELFGWRYDRADGTPGLVMISGYQGELDHFEFSLMYGELPPTCIAYPDSVTQEIRGLTVTADKYDGQQGCDRRVSFMKDNWGYRFDLTSTDAQRAELLTSRLVCRIAEKGLALSALEPSAPAETYTCEVCGQTFAADDSWRAHVHSSVGESAIPEFVPNYDPTYEDGAPDQDNTPAYDPREAADPSYNAPATVTCSDCGVTYPVGEAHYHTQTCPDCGAAYPAGTHHECELCNLPVAPTPGVYTCPECGVELPAGTAHSHTCQTCGVTYQAGTAHNHTCGTCGAVYTAGTSHSCGQGGHHGGHHGEHH